MVKAEALAEPAPAPDPITIVFFPPLALRKKQQEKE